MTRILVLTAGFGDGHNTAARGIQEAIEQTDPSARVEVVDLLRHSYGFLNVLARRAYAGMINHVPRVWGHLYRWLDRSAARSAVPAPLRRATRDLADLIAQTEPDCLLTTYPVYPAMVHSLYPDRSRRRFLLGVVVTDSITLNAAWYNAPADFYWVPNPETAAVLRAAGIAEPCLHGFGFPVRPRFALPPVAGDEDEWEPGRSLRVLYVLNHGSRKAAKTLRRLLDLPQVQLTVVTGRCPRLRRKLEAAAAPYGNRVTVLGWTERMPELMRQSHLVVTKAGGATVQEAMAAGCPVILTQVVPGQEEGNAEWVRTHGLGAVAKRPKEVARQLAHALRHRGFEYRRWRRNVARQQRPDAALRLAGFVLRQCRLNRPQSHSGHLPVAPLYPHPAPARRVPTTLRRRGLLCDFHVHSTYSDGRLELPEVVSFYGRQGFDVLCLTDHIADPQCLIGRVGERLRLTLSPDQIEAYFALLERERRRAWTRYGMLLLTGLEFNKEGFTPGTSTHLLGLGLHSPIDPALPLPDLMRQIRQQNGLVVAPHPHRIPRLLAKNTLHLWNHRHAYRTQIDAWEIANRNHIFSPVGLEELPYIAGSDFHQPAHIRSWKTLLFCEKDPERVKACIRQNTGVALVYYAGPGDMQLFSPTAPPSTGEPEACLPSIGADPWQPQRSHAACSV